MKIPFKKTYYDESEMKYINDALISGTDYIDKVKTKLSDIYGCKNIFLTCNGSSAFDLLFYALDFERGNEVIMPSFTYPSVANTVLRMGLVPVFCDIDKETLVMDIDDVERKITDKTCCIIPTSYGGASVDFDRLKNIAGQIPIIEDAALSYGAKHKNNLLGTIGDCGVISFHRTKNISAEEGGMLIVKDDELARKIDVIYDNGTDKKAFENNEVDFYSWQRAGMNVAMSNLSAAVLFAQIEKGKDVLSRQKKIYKYYYEEFSKMTEKYHISLPRIPEYNENNYHVFYLLFSDNKTREYVMKYLEAKGISAYIHYYPLHMSHMGAKLGYKPDELIKTYNTAETILRLPIHARMEADDCKKVVSTIGEALCKM